VLSGLLLILSFPKFGHGAFAWIALAPLLVALCGSSSWQAARLAYLTGASSSLGLLYWTALVVVQYGGLALPVGVAIMVALCLAFSIFHALFGWGMGRLNSAFGPVGLLGAPVVWVALEYARAHTFFSFPWCLLGYSQHQQLPFIQIASVTAVYGVSFLIVAVSSLLALAALEGRSAWRRGLLVAAIAIVGGAWLLGRWWMGVPVHERGKITVGLVQGGIRQEDKWVPENAWENIDRHLQLTEQAARRGARLLVWPESAVPFLFDENLQLAFLLRELTRRRGIYLFFGNDDRERPVPHLPLPGESRQARRGRIFVGAKLLDPSGEIVARYRKIRLVPFGEYVPLQPLFTVGGRYAAKLVQEVSDFSPGTEATTGLVDGHRIGGYICYEAIFPDLVRRFTAEGAELLVNVTNDAWYGTTSAPYQHLAMASFRAVENRRYMVRAANTGISAVVDPWGRVLEETRLFEPTVLVREVPFVSGTTFYTRHGDLFAQVCLAIALALVAATFRGRSTIATRRPD
jgi:apolipoprotein N-acyltransferase